MEMPQANSLYSYLKQTKHILKNREQEGKTGPVWEVSTSGRGNTQVKRVGE
jgi:hypothetical protein